MLNITVTEAKTHLLEIIRKADRTMQHFIVSKNGEPKAVIMSIDEYEGWIETLEIVSDKEALEDIKKAKKELKDGKCYTFEQVFKRKQRKRTS